MYAGAELSIFFWRQKGVKIRKNVDYFANEMLIAERCFLIQKSLSFQYNVCRYTFGVAVMWKEDEMEKEMWRPWDRKMKRLLIEAPEDFVAWLLKGASFKSLLSAELDADPVYADMLCEVMLRGRRVLLHIEFQKRRDTTMAKRLWEYNVRATLQYKYPVWSCVIYLKKDGKVAEPR